MEGLDVAQQSAWKRACETGTPFVVERGGEAVDLNPATNGGISHPLGDLGRSAAVPVVREETERD